MERTYYRVAKTRSPIPAIALLMLAGVCWSTARGENLVPGVHHLSTVGDTLAGARLDGIDLQGLTGWSASGAGDFNGDGFDDLLIGAVLASPNGVQSGKVFLVLGAGSPSELSGTLSLGQVGGVRPGLVFEGARAIDWAGWAVAGPGDVNGDGFDDALIAALKTDPNGSESGTVYLIYGTPDVAALPTRVDLATVGTVVPGACFHGSRAYDGAGTSIAGGDVNGDGLSDLLIGAPRAAGSDNNSGSVYLVYGRTGAAAPQGAVELSDVGVTVPGARIVSDRGGIRLGSGVSVGPDLNGDGVGDLLVGAHRAHWVGALSGQAHLVYGKRGASALTGRHSLATVGGSVDGVTFNGIHPGDEAGWSVAGAGDVNGDGSGDVLIGARYGLLTGEVYLVFGREPGNAAMTGSSIWPRSAPRWRACASTTTTPEARRDRRWPPPATRTATAEPTSSSPGCGSPWLAWAPRAPRI